MSTEAESESGTDSDSDSGGGTGTEGSLWQRLLAQRRRIATFATIALFLLLATHGSTVLPSTLELAIPVSAPSTVTALEVTLLDADGEEAHRITRRFDGDAPEAVEFEASLLPGNYDVEVRVTREGRESLLHESLLHQSLLHGAVHVPSEGRVRVRLTE